MRQASRWGWASIRSHLPRWAGAPLLVAVVIMASLGWVILARGTAPADGTVTFPSAPYWSERGVVINDVVSGVSGLRAGDCVVAVDGRPLDDLVRNGPALSTAWETWFPTTCVEAMRGSTVTARDHWPASRLPSPPTGSVQS